MQEIELKFQVPAAARRAVASAMSGPGRPNRVRLQAAYFDTVGRDLAQAGLALRVRREGRRWVQTLKGATGSDGLTRAEHNVPLATAGLETPPADPALHAGTPVGERLLALLAVGGAAHGDGLVCRYRTDIRRRARQVDVDAPGVAGDADRVLAAAAPVDDADPASAVDDPAAAGRVELAFDEGVIVAGDRRLAVCELEIEQLAGSPLAVIATASHWAARYGLWLDTRSKAERGDLLARGETVAPPRRAQPLLLTAGTGVGAGRRAVLLNCRDQIAVNASQVASGDFQPEHVHQLRVGLRRLRSALRLFAPTGVPAGAAAANTDAQALPQLDAQAAALFRLLGAARDADAITGPISQALAGAMRSVGVDGDAMPALPAAAAPDPAVCVRDAASQQLLLGLLRVGQVAAADAGGARALRRLLSNRLQRWHRQVKRDAERFVALDDEARHQLRKRAKRLRYAVEFAAALYPKRKAAAYARALRRLQDRLGRLNDLVVAVEAYRGVAGRQPRALFALGWLASRRADVLDGCTSDVDAFIGAKRFWREKRS